MKRLDAKVAFVTGAAHGQGRATALASRPAPGRIVPAWPGACPNDPNMRGIRCVCVSVPASALSGTPSWGYGSSGRRAASISEAAVGPSPRRPRMIRSRSITIIHGSLWNPQAVNSGAGLSMSRSG